jgi:hypothetical protein
MHRAFPDFVRIAGAAATVHNRERMTDEIVA